MKITYNPDAIDAEIKEMKEIASQSESTFSVIKSPWLRPTLIIAYLCDFQQFIGINAVIFYAPTIFTKAGLGGSASLIGTVGIGVVNVLVTILALFIVDRVDRKTPRYRKHRNDFFHWLLWRCLFGQSVFNHQPGPLLFVYHYLSCSLEFHGAQFYG